jgi:hypothetical protein
MYDGSLLKEAAPPLMMKVEPCHLFSHFSLGLGHPTDHVKNQMRRTHHCRGSYGHSFSLCPAQKWPTLARLLSCVLVVMR